MREASYSHLIDTITTGDALELSKALPDESIDLVFCDPPYLKRHIEDGIYMWLSETAARVLKPGGFCISYCGTYWLYEAMLQASIGGVAQSQDAHHCSFFRKAKGCPLVQSSTSTRELALISLFISGGRMSTACSTISIAFLALGISCLIRSVAAGLFPMSAHRYIAALLLLRLTLLPLLLPVNAWR